MRLEEFLLARIAEDETTARAAAPGPWSYGSIESVAGGSLYDPGVMVASVLWDNVADSPDPRIHRFRSEAQADKTGEHIARHDPARVIAECEAKRRIVELMLDMPTQPHGDCKCRSCWTLRLLALPYSSHPDYRQEWTP